MIREARSEYCYRFGKKRFLGLRSLVCYCRMLQFRVSVLMSAMQNTTSLIRKHYIKKKLKLKYGVDIGMNSKIGEHPWVEHYEGLVIGNGAIIGDNCTFYQGVTIGQRRNQYPVLGNNVTVFPNAVVLGKIRIENNAIVLAGSVVLDNVPANTIVGGNPAVVKKKM